MCRSVLRINRADRSILPAPILNQLQVQIQLPRHVAVHEQVELAIEVVLPPEVGLNEVIERTLAQLGLEGPRKIGDLQFRVLQDVADFGLILEPIEVATQVVGGANAIPMFVIGHQVSCPNWIPIEDVPIDLQIRANAVFPREVQSQLVGVFADGSNVGRESIPAVVRIEFLESLAKSVDICGADIRPTQIGLAGLDAIAEVVEFRGRAVARLQRAILGSCREAVFEVGGSVAGIAGSVPIRVLACLFHLFPQAVAQLIDTRVVPSDIAVPGLANEWIINSAAADRRDVPVVTTGVLSAELFESITKRVVRCCSGIVCGIVPSGRLSAELFQSVAKRIVRCCSGIVRGLVPCDGLPTKLLEAIAQLGIGDDPGVAGCPIRISSVANRAAIRLSQLRQVPRRRTGIVRRRDVSLLQAIPQSIELVAGRTVVRELAD
ncbi:MAG: hypothetical protein B7Z55_13540, partial [Planctomycetales bacterium 12-60-4]